MGESKMPNTESNDAMLVDTPEGIAAIALSEVKSKKSKKRILEASAVANDETTSEEPLKKKKKRRKEREIVEEVDRSAALSEPMESVVDTINEAEGSSSFKKDKKKSKGSKEDDAVGSKHDKALMDADVLSKKERKTQKKDKRSKELAREDTAMVLDAQEAGPQAETEAKSVDAEKSKEKKRKKEKISKQEGTLDELPSPIDESTPLVVQPETSPSPSLKKREKRPKDRVKNIPIEDASPSEPATKKKKKARKNRTSFPDPESDKSLNPQARKALDYAFTQFNAPKEWKFNKARQNWMIRNVFNVESIPETYLSLAIKYLSGLQGGSREKLKETCTSIINAPPPKVASPDEPKSILKKTTDESTPPTKATSSAKAGPLIDAPRAGPLIDASKADAVLESEIPKQRGPSPSEAKLQRAKGLLEALDTGDS